MLLLSEIMDLYSTPTFAEVKQALFNASCFLSDYRFIWGGIITGFVFGNLYNIIHAKYQLSDNRTEHEI